jgi:hypothetical protein
MEGTRKCEVELELRENNKWSEKKNAANAIGKGGGMVMVLIQHALGCRWVDEMETTVRMGNG